jgi:hypothetical protein
VENTYGCETAVQGNMFDEKNQRAKISSDFVPLGKGARCIKLQNSMLTDKTVHIG